MLPPLLQQLAALSFVFTHIAGLQQCCKWLMIDFRGRAEGLQILPGLQPIFAR